MTVKERRILLMTCVISLVFGIVEPSMALNIISGGISGTQCAIWALLCIPFVVCGVFGIKRNVHLNKKSVTIMILAGAFVFVLSLLRIPAVPECCSHMTGAGFAAMTFGPAVTSVMGITVLTLQAIFLPHGSFATIGANTVSLGIVGPFATWGIYKLCGRKRVNRKAAIMISVGAGDIVSTLMTSIQLSIGTGKGPGIFILSVFKYMVTFIPTQIPLALAEGVLTLLVIMGLDYYERAALHSVGIFLDYKEEDAAKLILEKKKHMQLPEKEAHSVSEEEIAAVIRKESKKGKTSEW